MSGSSVAHSVPASSAASGSHAASSQAPGSSHASSSSAASENEVDAKIDSYIRQLQNLKRQTESKLYGVIYEADEWVYSPPGGGARSGDEGLHRGVQNRQADQCSGRV